MNKKGKTKMNKLALTWTALKGLLNPFGSVFESLADYALGYVNEALGGLNVSRKDRIQAALNITTKALAVLNAVAWLCPVKWQTAYKATVGAVQDVCDALFDLHLTMDELANVRERFSKAYAEWFGPDDETCVA